jgi:probable DNA metabolism protein
MITIEVSDFASWRINARRLIQQRVPPDRVLWVDARGPQDALPFGAAAPSAPGASTSSSTLDANAIGSFDIAETKTDAAAMRVPRRFVEKAEDAAHHRRGDRWALLYRVLWRIQFENRALLDLVADTDVHALDRLASQVRRDEHKMRAFVRFTPIQDAEGEHYVAYYEPDHLIVRKAAPFFADRFSSMRWSILTPDLSAHWDRERLTFTEGVPAPLRPQGGEIEQLWRTYYGAIFNPARVNRRAMQREMPQRRWAGLPEAALIPSLLSSAHERGTALQRAPSDQNSARRFVPQTADLATLRNAAPACRGCDLHARATQVVFGEGRPDARLVLIGEQPGDAEDLAGRPFVGPAGQVLDRALAEVGIDRDGVYVTNAVKHFSFEDRGKRRIHKTPRSSEIRACRPWLEAELQALHPACVVCLGSTAAQSLLGPQARVMQQRGRIITHTAWAPALIITIHPSAVLRADDGESYYQMLVSDLRLAAGQ